MENNARAKAMSNEKSKRVRLEKRKESLKKKLYELSTLCGVEVAMVCYEPDGSIDTWPENHSQIRSVFERFKNVDRLERGKRTLDCPSIMEAKKIKLEKKLDQIRRNSSDVSEASSAEATRIFGNTLDAKAEEKIELMKENDPSDAFVPLQPSPIRGMPPPLAVTLSWPIQVLPPPTYSSLLLSPLEDDSINGFYNDTGYVSPSDLMQPSFEDWYNYDYPEMQQQQQQSWGSFSLMQPPFEDWFNYDYPEMQQQQQSWCSFSLMQPPLVSSGHEFVDGCIGCASVSSPVDEFMLGDGNINGYHYGHF